jgi:hypothetical protein
MDIGTVRAGVDLLARVPGFVRRQFTVEEARAIQAARLRERETRFLQFMRRAVYALPDQPIHQLLRHAGCTFGDLEALVGREGLEGALGVLLRQGVYLSVDEFKGRKPAVRGSTTIETSPERLRNPLAAFHIRISSSGSRSAGTPILLDLEYIHACAVSCALYLHGRGGWNWTKVMWEPIGPSARYRQLKFSCYGPRVAVWFTQLDPATAALNPALRWSFHGLRWSARLGGVRLPKPVVATVNDPSPVLRYVRAALDRGETPYVRVFPSTIVRLAALAPETGVDLSGTKATLGGEPMTQARLDLLAQAGIEATPRYASMENGPIACACLNPEAPDDMHLVRELHALIQAGDFSEQIGLPERALLITDLHPKAPFTLLNVSMGDEADLGARDCGCPMQAYGWTPQLKNLRSYEKLTAGGMTFHDTELIGVLERALPERFGGHPADYQLVEREDAQGKSSLALLVHPRLGPLDEAAVAEAFLRAIGKSPAEKYMASMWRQADMVRVERRAPLATASHKILHLHVDRPRG